MKRSALLMLSSLLLNTASYAGNTKCDECYDLSTKNAAALHYTTSKPNSSETRYWDDFLHSGQKDITVYVRDLSRKDAQAALWFITTGGKHGFAAREATAQERVLLEDAIKQVAISYGTRSNTGRGLQEWSQVSNANHAGHLHLQMIYKQIDDLQIKVTNLEYRVNLLEIAKKEDDKRFTDLQADLKAERESRTSDIDKLMTKLPALMKPQTDEIKNILTVSENNWKTIIARWDANDERDRLERENLKTAAAAEKTDYENKLAAQKLADKTAAEANEKKLKEAVDAEKVKAQSERDKKKEKKKTLKAQLAEYKAKAEEADREKAVTNALKERDEEIRKEREAMAREREAAIEREKKANKANSDLRAGLTYLANARTSGQTNIDYDRIKALLNPNAN